MRKRVWGLSRDFLVVLTQHILTTGKPIRSLGWKLSCDFKTRRPVLGPFQFSCHMPRVKMHASTSVKVPRLGKSYNCASVRQAIVEAVQTLGYMYPTRYQAEVIETFVCGRDVFVSLPTGSGKSVCYACLPLVFDSLGGGRRRCQKIVVVAPLSALMEDQVASFKSRGLKASFVGVSLSMKEEDAVIKGDIQLVFMSPETILSDSGWRDMLNTSVYQKHLVALAVDEAHLVEKWSAM